MGTLYVGPDIKVLFIQAFLLSSNVETLFVNEPTLCFPARSTAPFERSLGSAIDNDFRSEVQFTKKFTGKSIRSWQMID